ncbi:MAG: hypothetical protein AAGA96_20060 [Verrucomicrobiota bacterium]
MADIKIPEEIAEWMIERGWSAHHDQWHFERRWDYWGALKDNPAVPEPFRQWINNKFAEANTNGWSRADIQEGEVGNGEEFLFMHRAMIELIITSFPQHVHYFRGWHTPPRDYSSSLDPVPVPDTEPPRECHPLKKLICDPMLSAIDRIETSPTSFSSDDDFGLYVETNQRPTPGNPTGRSDDASTGIHNYLHGRWSGMSADLDLGDPRFNIFNTRFWRLHGWIDHQWWLFRLATGADDKDPDYQAKLNSHKEMMNMTHHDHHDHLDIASIEEGAPATGTVNAFIDLIAEIE